MTYHVKLSPGVDDEILSAAFYIARESVPSAERWLDGIYEAIQSLGSMPERCGVIRENEEFAEELRELRYQSHRIIFVVQEQTVRVVHIRHAARDEWKPDEE